MWALSLYFLSLFSLFERYKLYIFYLVYYFSTNLPNCIRLSYHNHILLFLYINQSNQAKSFNSLELSIYSVI